MIAYACPLCVARGKTWKGSDPKCGFLADGSFNPNNWNCATLAEVRMLAEQGEVRIFCDYSQSTALIDTYKVDELHDNGSDDWSVLYFALWVTWYKSRGKTDGLWLMSDAQPPRQPTEREVNAILRHHGRASVRQVEQCQAERIGHQP